VYLVTIEGRGLLVDAGCGGATAKILTNIRRCGLLPTDIKLLLLTHCHYDHTGGAVCAPIHDLTATQLNIWRHHALGILVSSRYPQ